MQHREPKAEQRGTAEIISARAAEQVECRQRSPNLRAAR